MSPRSRQNAQKFTPGGPTGAGGYPWRPQGYPPGLKVSNFDANITEMKHKIQKYSRKYYRKSAVVAPVHTQNKNKTKYTRNCYRKFAIVAPLHMNRDVKFTKEHQQTLH